MLRYSVDSDQRGELYVRLSLYVCMLLPLCVLLSVCLYIILKIAYRTIVICLSVCLSVCRYSMYIEDGVVKSLNVEPNGTGLTCSLAENVLKFEP